MLHDFFGYIGTVGKCSVVPILSNKFRFPSLGRFCLFCLRVTDIFVGLSDVGYSQRWPAESWSVGTFQSPHWAEVCVPMRMVCVRYSRESRSAETWSVVLFLYWWRLAWFANWVWLVVKLVINRKVFQIFSIHSFLYYTENWNTFVVFLPIYIQPITQNYG